MCVTFVTCEVRVCGLRCRSGSSFYIYRVYLLSYFARRSKKKEEETAILLLLHGVRAYFAPEPSAFERRAGKKCERVFSAAARSRHIYHSLINLGFALGGDACMQRLSNKTREQQSLSLPWETHVIT